MFFFSTTTFSGNVPVQVLQTSRVATPQREFHWCNDKRYHMCNPDGIQRIQNRSCRPQKASSRIDSIFYVYYWNILCIYTFFNSWKCSKMTKQINFYILWTCRRLYTIYVYAFDRYDMHTYTSNYCQVYVKIHTHGTRIQIHIHMYKHKHTHRYVEGHMHANA